jgi:hypothetical protein
MDTTFNSRGFVLRRSDERVGENASHSIFHETEPAPTTLVYQLAARCVPNGKDPEAQLKTFRLLYNDFLQDLLCGMFLQLLADGSRVENIHCKVLTDGPTMVLDRDGGTLIHFPIEDVTNMTLMRLRIAEEEKGAYNNFNFIVVFHFYQRRIAFAFREHQVAQRFLACFELLVRNVKQSEGSPQVQSRATGAPSRPDPSLPVPARRRFPLDGQVDTM